MILNLPKGCGVVFGIDKAQFSYISPLITTKSPDAVKLPVIDHLPEIKKEKDEEQKQSVNNAAINFEELG
jgi:hypothetical protein